MEQQSRAWERLARRGSPAAAVPCRDATGSGQCVEQTSVHTHCTVVAGADGEPVKHCVKVYRRYLKCAGRPEQREELKDEVTVRGEGAVDELEDLGLAHPPCNSLSMPGAQGAALLPPQQQQPQPPLPAAQLEDVGHAFAEFLRFAEELQEQMVPGTMQLDQLPTAAAWPYDGAAEEQQPQQQQQEHAGQQEQQRGAGEPPPQSLGWLGGLLFGRRRGAAQEAGRGSSGAAGRQRVDTSTWKEFEKDFTEV